MSDDIVECKRVQHAGTGQIYICVADEKSYLQELLFKYNQCSADTSTKDYAHGVRTTIITILEHLDRMEAQPREK